MKSYVNLNRWVIVTAFVVSSTLAFTGCSNNSVEPEVTNELQTTVDSLRLANAQMDSLMNDQSMSINNLNDMIAQRDARIRGLRNSVNRANQTLRESREHDVVGFFMTRYDGLLNNPDNPVDLTNAKTVTLPEPITNWVVDDLTHGDSITVEHEVAVEQLGQTRALVATQEGVISSQQNEIAGHVSTINVKNAQLTAYQDTVASQEARIQKTTKQNRWLLGYSIVSTLANIGQLLVK
jgi:flagellar biosynthesis/type III secretory pathway chaperone